jgi:hypothetical protein
MSLKTREATIDCYQDLILLEYEKLKKTGYRFEDPFSRLTASEINQLTSLYYSITVREITLLEDDVAPQPYPGPLGSHVT